MGQIITFYSYKGGTGRSMALANVAWALASNRQKVLVIDWDLEAPGLHRYFRAFLSDKELIEPDSKGLIEFVRNYATLAATPPADGDRPANWYESHAQIWKWATPLRWPRGQVLNFGNRGEIQFVPAGRQGLDYAERINTFDWYTLYQAHGGDGFFQSVREQAKREFDYVLIDSRTGVSDTSGICTIQMPDILVACYTYNFQSIIGASDIARRVCNKRPDLVVFPVAMRVEFTETDSLIPMRKLARERFGDLVTTANRGEYFDKAEVPYYPKYSFFERLAAFEEFPNAKGSINSDVRHLASLIAGGEMMQAPIDESRRRDVVQEFDPTPAKIMPDVPVRLVQPIPKQLKWVTLAWGVLFPLLILLLVTAWKHLPPIEGISVNVDPPTATLSESDKLQLVATVHGSSDSNVIWAATLGKITSSGLYLAPATATDQTDTITATSTVDRSQSGTAALRITKHTHYVVNPVTTMLKAGERQAFKVEFINSESRDGTPVLVDWIVSPNTGTFLANEPASVLGSASVLYVAPKDLLKRQRVTLTPLSSRQDYVASAGIELSPETSQFDRWAYLILMAAAGALGASLAATRALLTYIGNRVLRTGWLAYFMIRPLFGAVVGLTTYFAVNETLGSAQAPIRNTATLVGIAFVAGLFTDTVTAKLQETFDTVFKPITPDERSK